MLHQHPLRRIVLTLIVATLTAAAAHAGELVDMVDLADAPVTSAGDVSRDIVGDFVGGHDLRRLARILRGCGSSLQFQLRVRPDQPTTIEIEELYGRDHEVRAYQVLVDDRPIFFRTWQGCGAGPVHYFVQIPPSDRSQVTVTLLSAADAPVAIARVWSFSNFARYFAAGAFDVPYHIAPTVRVGRDFESDLSRLAQIRDSLGDHPHIRPAWTTWIGYANLSDQQIERAIDHILRLAEQADMPVQLSLDTWWAHTPSGPDGKGGTWRDQQYQQVVYNATRRRWQLSVPNRWSSTPWLSVNHPDLLAFKTQRLTRAMQILRQRCDAFAAAGNPARILALNLDNEPIYWASGNAGLGEDLLLADFNEHTVAAAKADGVRLDPTDGLDRDERLWLHRNLLRYHEAIAAAAVSGLGDATMVLPDGSIDLLRGNIYTQGFAANAALQYPMLDPTWGLWETAAASSVRLGAEWNGDSLREREAMARMAPLGRIASVNIECGNDASNNHSIDTAYAMGHRFWAPYNYPPDRMDVAAEPLRDLSRPQAPFVYQPVLLEHRFDDEIAWQRIVAEHSGVATRLIGNTAAFAATPGSADAPGRITYRLRAPAGGFADGLDIELSGRAFVHRKRDPRVHIRILAGADEQTLAEIGRIDDAEDINHVHRFGLSEIARGQEQVVVQIELTAPDLPEELLSWCAVHHVRFTTPWPAELLGTALPQDHSLATQRMQNLVIAWRRDAELAMAQLDAVRDADLLTVAKQQYEQGMYVAAYRIAALRAAAKQVSPRVEDPR